MASSTRMACSRIDAAEPAEAVMPTTARNSPTTTLIQLARRCARALVQKPQVMPSVQMPLEK